VLSGGDAGGGNGGSVASPDLAGSFADDAGGPGRIQKDSENTKLLVEQMLLVFWSGKYWF
jgi:hypothetical protein